MKQLKLFGWPPLNLDQPQPSNREERIRDIAVRRSEMNSVCMVINDDHVPELYWGCCLHEAYRGVKTFSCLICTLNERTDSG